MRTNYVLLDFENVQPPSLEALAHDHFKLLVFVGASQTKVPFEIAASLQQLGAQALSHPLIYASPNTAVNVRRPSSISPKRCTSGRSRSSGIIGISS